MLENDKLLISAQISWVYTRDLEETAGFYARILGLECSRDNRFTLHYPINDFSGQRRLLWRCTALES